MTSLNTVKSASPFNLEEKKHYENEYPQATESVYSWRPSSLPLERRYLDQ